MVLPLRKRLKERRKLRRQQAFDQEVYRRDIGALLASFKDGLIHFYRILPEIEQKMKDLPGTNYTLGARYFREGRFADALMRFRIVLWLRPRHPQATFKAGRCYHALGNQTKAHEYYQRALKLKPDYTEASFMLAVLGDKRTLANRIPLPLVLEQFERLAPYYRSHYIDRMGYNGHIAMEKSVTDWVSEKIAGDDNPVMARFDLFELGACCGITGERLRVYAKSSIGIDICKAMLEAVPPPTQAGQAPVYDKMFVEEASVFLNRQPHSTVDIIAAAGVFNYVGELQDIIVPAAKALRSGGLLAFSIERAPEDGVPYGWLMQRGTFGHNLGYIRDLCAAQGLKEYRIDDIMLYRGAPGYQCMFTKP